MKRFLIALAAACIVWLPIMLIVRALGWDTDFFAGWSGCLVFSALTPPAEKSAPSEETEHG